jgi:hypothetical protein
MLWDHFVPPDGRLQTYPSCCRQIHKVD